MRSPLAESAVAASQSTWRLVTPIRHELRWRVRPATLLRSTITCLVVAQLGRIPFISTSDREAPLLINDLAVLAVLFVAMLGSLYARSLRLDRVAGLGLVFAALGAFTTMLAVPRYGLNGFEIAVSLAYLARWTAYFLLYVVVINVVRAADVVAVWRTLERTVLAFASFGLFQAVFLPHFAQLIYPEAGEGNEWDQQGHRLVSTVLDPNIAGAMILLVLLVHVAQLASGNRTTPWKSALLFASLLATLSRSSFLGLVVGSMIVMGVYGVSRRILRAGMALGVLLLAALPKLISFAQGYNKLSIDGSALTRVTQWLRALRIFSDHPLLGIGFNTYAFVQERYGYTRLGRGSYALDGGLIFIAVMTGIAGLLLYVGMISVVVSRCRRVWRDARLPAEWRTLAVGIGAGGVAICVQSTFVNSLLTTFVMEMLWIMWGLAFVMAAAPEGAVPGDSGVVS